MQEANKKTGTPGASSPPNTGKGIKFDEEGIKK